MPLINLMRALLPVILTVFAIYIAFQQYKTNRRKLKFDLFDKRFTIFDATKKFMQGVINRSSFDKENQAEFHRQIKGAQFVFGNDIKEYLDIVWSNFVDLETWSQDENTSEHAKERHETMKWFVQELNNIDEKFTRYMKLKH